METPLGIFSFSGLEKRSLHLRAIEKGLFVASILRFHKTITFHHVLPLMILVLPHLSSTPRGGLGTFWRRTCTAPSAFQPPRLLHGRAASYGSIIVWKYQEAAYSIFKVPPFVLDAPGRVGNLLAADLHRSIGLSAAPPSSWPGRELRKYHCLEVPGGCLFNFQGSLHSFGLVLNLGRGLCCGYSVPEN